MVSVGKYAFHGNGRLNEIAPENIEYHCVAIVRFNTTGLSNEYAW